MANKKNPRIAGHTWSEEDMTELRHAYDNNTFEDEVGLCEFLVRRYQCDLTLAQAEKLLNAIKDR